MHATKKGRINMERKHKTEEAMIGWREEEKHIQSEWKRQVEELMLDRRKSRKTTKGQTNII